MFGVERRVTGAVDRLLGSEMVRWVIGRRTLDRPALFEASTTGVESVHRYGHAETVSFERQVALDPVPSRLAMRPVSTDTPPWTVLECSDVQLVGPEGLTFLPDGRVLLENSLGWNKRVGVSAARSVLERTLPVRRDGHAARSVDTAVSLVGPWTDNFYHWHFDYLVRLAALSSYTATSGKEPLLLLPPETSDWMRDALSLVGYDESDWRVWDGRRTNVDRLVVPALPRETEGSAPRLPNHYYSLNPDAVRWLGERMRSHVADDVPSHAPDTGRLYVSRQGGDSRRVSNLDSLAPLLETYGFERFRPEEHSVAEQVATFADADVVLGVHGAGLTNLLFATDATLVELFGSYVNPVFYALAVQTNNEYACAGFEPRGDDLHVDPDRLRALFDLAGVAPVA
ncbi:glycosyltransferase family 61 protein [Haloarchaeobius salinus]|uniref:glycosyltransferase family 61 protein n=1 Tax=Haloarchaeobius salinus TaxID=1198298 RepID=UPI00210F1F1C|nr:glycosyltransferase family 61 protein [Haloarchaeobius salinus]